MFDTIGDFSRSYAGEVALRCWLASNQRELFAVAEIVSVDVYDSRVTALS